MSNIEDLKKRKDQLEQSLNHCKVALTHDDYAKPFVFKRMDRMTVDMVNHPLLKVIAGVCIEKNIGFDPSLALQHIEREALEQFNEVVTTRVKGVSIPNLMTMRHDLELLMLKDQFNHYSVELEKADKNLLEAIARSSLEVDTVATRKKVLAKAHKKK